ncbi:MAG: phosphatase PAP2 family protein [Fidelibacterota bacterium]
MVALRPIELILLLYEATLTVHLILAPHPPKYFTLHLLINLVIITILVLPVVRRQKRQSTTPGFIRTFYPLFLFIWLYPQATVLRHTLITNDLDAVILRWEKIIFRNYWFELLPQSLNNFWMEFFHGSYFLYYLGLGVFAMLAFWKHRGKVNEYLFTVIATMIVHLWIIILFPTRGPADARILMINQGSLFTNIMNFIYSIVPVYGGAFPSLHAAAAVVMTAYASLFFPRWKYPLILFLFSILVATVACAYHYSIDTLVGAIDGVVALYIFPRIYPKFQTHA